MFKLLAPVYWSTPMIKSTFERSGNRDKFLVLDEILKRKYPLAEDPFRHASECIRLSVDNLQPVHDGGYITGNLMVLDEGLEGSQQFLGSITVRPWLFGPTRTERWVRFRMDYQELCDSDFDHEATICENYGDEYIYRYISETSEIMTEDGDSFEVDITTLIPATNPEEGKPVLHDSMCGADFKAHKSYTGEEVVDVLRSCKYDDDDIDRAINKAIAMFAGKVPMPTNPCPPPSGPTPLQVVESMEADEIKGQLVSHEV